MTPIPEGILRPEAERYFGVLLEEMNGKFDLIMEFLPAIDANVLALAKRVDAVEARLEALELEMVALRQDVRQVQGDIKILKCEVAEIKEKLGGYVNQAEFSALQKRVGEIERMVA